MKKFLILCLLLAFPINVNAKTIDMGEFKITAYCPCDGCSEGYGRQCAMPNKCAQSEHTIAVDPDVIDIGSKVKIGDTIYTAEDTGRGVEGDHIDIFFDTHEEVEDFGVHYYEVTIIRQ